jgi:hypothetical protein
MPDNVNLSEVRRLPSIPTILDQSPFTNGGKPSLMDRADQYDKFHCDAPENLLLQTEFSHLDRANLIRTAKAMSELRDVFKQTARIEVTNQAYMVLVDRLIPAMEGLNRRLDQLEAAILALAPKKRKRKALVKK